jgi:hypothetical protein
MSKLKRKSGRGLAIMKLFGICIATLALGALCFFLVQRSLLSGELKIPGKFSSGPASIVSHSQLPAVYYGLLTLVAAGGFASISAVFMIAWLFWRATPEQREVILMMYMPLTSKRRPRVLRPLLLFVAVPLVAVFIIMIIKILKSS